MEPVTRQDLLVQIKQLAHCIDTEAAQRMLIERSKEFQAIQADVESTQGTIAELQKEVSALYERSAEMLRAVPDTRPQLEEAKALLVDLMKIEGVEGYNEDWISVSGRFSETRSVDGKRVLDVLGGDIDEFVRMVKPTQKAIKEYAAEHEEIKKPLLQCIRLEGRELVGVDIQLPEAQ